jgi:outer membrane protein OmpA-like peptidoglycan-associated protein
MADALEAAWTMPVRAAATEPGEKPGGIEGAENMSLYRLEVMGLAASLAVLGATGCATKNYVRTQTTPLVEHTAQSASKSAADADTAAVDVVHRADTLDGVVKGLDNYKSLADVSVTFGFDKAALTKDDKDQLDSFAAQLGTQKSYILEVTGGTDSTGPAQYNYDLSQRRADAVVQYLATKYNVAAHRFYLIGIGKDKEVAPNTTADGRKQNRRVEIQLLTNMGNTDTQSATNQGSGR